MTGTTEISQFWQYQGFRCRDIHVQALTEKNMSIKTRSGISKNS